MLGIWESVGAMPRACTVCSHPDRSTIDQMLVNLRPFRTIAHQFGLTHWALIRHYDDHLTDFLLRAKAAEEVAEADDLLAELRSLRDRTYRLLEQAEKAGDTRAAFTGIREIRSTLELLAELVGKLDRKPTLNLWISAEWLTVRAAILDALRGCSGIKGPSSKVG